MVDITGRPEYDRLRQLRRLFARITRHRIHYTRKYLRTKRRVVHRLLRRVRKCAATPDRCDQRTELLAGCLTALWYVDLGRYTRRLHQACTDLGFRGVQDLARAGERPRPTAGQQSEHPKPVGVSPSINPVNLAK